MSSLNIFDVFGNQIISEIETRIDNKLNESKKEIGTRIDQIQNNIENLKSLNEKLDEIIKVSKNSLDRELETTKDIVKLTENFNVLVDILNNLITEYNKLKTETGKTFENIDMKFLGLAD